jgi:WD40 repeat protein
MLRSRFLLACLVLCPPLLAADGQSPPQAKDLQGDALPPFAALRLGTVRWRHDDTIGFAAFLPDGKSVISVAGDRTIRVWEFPSGKELRRITLYGDAGPELFTGAAGLAGGRSDLAAALSRDGKIIAAYIPNRVASRKQNSPEIHLFDVGSGKALPALKTSSTNISSLAFSPRSEHLMSVDDDGTTRIWDWAHATELRRFATPGSGDGMIFRPSNLDAQESREYSPDGNTLVFLTRTNALRFVDVRTGQEIGPSGHTTPVKSVQFNSSGKQLVTQAADGSINRWDAASGKSLGFGPIIKLLAKGSPKLQARNSATSPDGQIFVNGLTPSPNGRVLTLTDCVTGSEISKISMESAAQPALWFSPGNKLLAVVANAPNSKFKGDRQIELYEVATGKRLHTLSIDPKAMLPLSKTPALRGAQTLIFSPDGQEYRQYRLLLGHRERKTNRFTVHTQR